MQIITLRNFILPAVAVASNALTAAFDNDSGARLPFIIS
jgi:hypothetical protein